MGWVEYIGREYLFACVRAWGVIELLGSMFSEDLGRNGAGAPRSWPAAAVGACRTNDRGSVRVLAWGPVSRQSQQGKRLRLCER